MTAIFIGIGLLLLLLLVGGFLCNLLLRRRRRRKSAGTAAKPQTARAGRNTPQSFLLEREWLAEVSRQDIFITARDGLHLRARLMPQGNARCFVILLHGYKAHSGAMGCWARPLYEAGYSLLLPDARAHGHSEGHYIGMGWPERLDLLDWIAEIRRRYPEARIALFGVSMGATTVMNALGEAALPSISCAVADCGYVSLRDELVFQLERRFHLPAYPALWAASLMARFHLHLSLLYDGDTERQLRQSTTPLLLIHGRADRFVPVEMLHRAQKASGGETQTLLIPGAAHAGSVLADPARYWQTVFAFMAAHEFLI